jgi:hypothetical protein
MKHVFISGSVHNFAQILYQIYAYPLVEPSIWYFTCQVKVMLLFRFLLISVRPEIAHFASGCYNIEIAAYLFICPFFFHFMRFNFHEYVNWKIIFWALRRIRTLSRELLLGWYETSIRRFQIGIKNDISLRYVSFFPSDTTMQLRIPWHPVWCLKT